MEKAKYKQVLGVENIKVGTGFTRIWIVKLNTKVIILSLPLNETVV